MIPDIGLMIGAYIVLRCVELLCSSGNRFAKPWARIVVMVFAVLTALLTVALTYDLVHAALVAGVPKFIPPDMPGLR